MSLRRLEHAEADSADSETLTEVNECVLEVRYSPEPGVLDNIGALTRGLLDDLRVTEWQAITNRTDVFSTDRTVRAFVGFQNAGLILRMAPDATSFSDRLRQFVGRFTVLPPFNNRKLPVQRVGVRLRLARAWTDDWDSLLQRYLTRTSASHREFAAIFDGPATDVGFAYHFETRYGTVRVSGGPMKKKQLNEHFTEEVEEDLPEVALYYDIDHFHTQTDPLDRATLMRQVQGMNEGNWRFLQGLEALIMGS